MKILKNLLYTKEHEWIKVEGNKAYIGITDFAQHALGSIVYVELPEVDSELSAGETLGAIESVKAASDIFIPLDGKIVEINETIVDEPALVNEDAFENWMVAIEMTDKSQLESLLSPEAYEELCKEGE
ncbi:glycine cleavage system protein GcvH [Clostridium sp. YIM B02515]|uniref:Glycine cleavage system H protein n=1 Tax=Clostridium rhizosphaerae TaxID=2803861 RepID=A0ABS1TG23_9CLOT|nr:glycine cleavage system protein GcvH [Clostridium rhizosphaerae]MBL4937566.1 glycine cleavage system protein GcvH [Clostridium rhizosphaerae]